MDDDWQMFTRPTGPRSLLGHQLSLSKQGIFTFGPAIFERLGSPTYVAFAYKTRAARRYLAISAGAADQPGVSKVQHPASATYQVAAKALITFLDFHPPRAVRFTPTWDGARLIINLDAPET